MNAETQKRRGEIKESDDRFMRIMAHPSPEMEAELNAMADRIADHLRGSAGRLMERWSRYD